MARKLSRSIDLAGRQAVASGTRIDASQLAVKIGDGMYDLYDVLEGLGDNDNAQVLAVQTALSAEVTRAKASEAAIASDLSDYEAANDAALGAEITRAKASENALGVALTAEVTRAKASELAIEGKIDGVLALSSADLDTFVEVVAAYELADTNIIGSISNEVTRAKASEAAIASDLSDEVAARLAGDSAEASRASAREDDIETSMNSAEDRASMFTRESFDVLAGATLITFLGAVPADGSEMVTYNGLVLEKDLDYFYDGGNSMIQFVGFPGGALPNDGRVVVVGLIDKTSGGTGF